jgi:starch phosphorylase
MAHMDIHYGFSVNGVAALHTDILKNTELKHFYDIYPGKFNNKTNGVTFRRWLMACNPALAELITQCIGEGWKRNPEQLEKLLAFRKDAQVLDKLLEIKAENKRRLSAYLYQTQNISLDPESIFDIQVKRLHEYKRQQMNALYAIHQYLRIKAGYTPARPITVIFGAKAAPAYIMAKNIIHLILCLQKLVNQDPEVSRWMRIVMVENYNVTLAEELIPAADLSEQISLASKEASGTSNMKFMANGALTIGTLDGANVEIADLVGEDNIYLFGALSDKVIDLYARNGYHPDQFYSASQFIREAVDFITGPEMSAIGDLGCLQALKGDLMGKDYFMALLDVRDYAKVKDQALWDYEGRRDWAAKTLVNIGKSGFFSSDRTIQEYNRDIWHL